VTDQACDLGLVHRVDHGGGRTESAEHLGDRREISDGRATSAQLQGDERAQHPRFTQGGDGFAREAGLAIDGISERSGNLDPDASSGVEEILRQSRPGHA
jgi:hypothetical protein